jgi:hypothetical protein
MRNESKQPWFDVDRAGLKKLLEDRGKEFALYELVQNAWDEAGVTRVEITLKPASNGHAKLTVIDDAPEGFKYLHHAYTLFAESTKKANPRQRGRFNLGEKLVLAICKRASIKTTKGSVFFDSDGNRRQESDCTKAGSIFEAEIEMNSKDFERVTRKMSTLLAPAEIVTVFNDAYIATREPKHTIEAVMETYVEDSERHFRRTSRKTQIHLHEPRDGEMPTLYEMGIPICKIDCAFHCDVMQKVPVTLDRKNTLSGYFKKRLALEVMNVTHAELSVEQTNETWVQKAIEQHDIAPEAVQSFMTNKFGEKRVSFDMSDPEANRTATAHGYTVVTGGMLSGAAWDNVKEHEAIQPAGQLFPTQPEKSIATEPVEPDENMKRVAAYALKLAELLLGCSITVRFCKQASYENASWGGRSLSFNVRNLGRKWFDLDTNQLRIDDLIIHEFGHHYESNHLDEHYYRALTKLAAKAMQLGREGRLPKA